jgi:hypothetical protein
LAAVALPAPAATPSAPHPAALQTAGKLRVGVFAATRLQPRWVVEAFAAIARSACAEVVAIGLGPGSESGEPWLSRAYAGLDQWAFRAADGCEPVDLLDALAEARLFTPPFPGLLELDLDVAFALGEVDEAPFDGVTRLGVWRFQVDGAAEVAAGEPLSSSALTVRLARGAVPRVAYQSWARTDPLSFARNRAALLQKTAEFPLRALREAQRSGREWLEQRPLAKKQGQTPVSVLPVVGRILKRGVEKAVAVEQWSLAFSFSERDLNPALEGFTRIVPPAERDWSEPFALEKNGRYYVFFKEMLRGAAKAHIAMLELEPGGRWSAPVRVLERDYHLSHPFVLEHDGQLYLVPESAKNRTVEAYRCVDFPRRWRLERVLLDGVRLVDATFLRAPDRLWMFANGAAGGSAIFNDELHLFHAASLLDEWQPHPRNPVRSDVRGARPAGSLYWRDGALYRPAKICVPRYGAGVTLNRVLRLSPQAYAERAVESIVPPAGGALLGLHTVNRAGSLTVADALARRRRI